MNTPGLMLTMILWYAMFGAFVAGVVYVFRRGFHAYEGRTAAMGTTRALEMRVERLERMLAAAAAYRGEAAGVRGEIP